MLVVTTRIRASSAISLALWGMIIGGYFSLTPGTRAGGPIFGRPAVWDTNRPVPFTPDQGPLGKLDNEQAVALVGALFSVWSEVDTAAITFAQAGQLEADVTAANYLQILNALPATVSPVIFDADGSITDAVFGQGARHRVLGFAGPRLASGDRIQGAMAVLNGAFIDGRPDPTDIPLELFRAVFIHEFGHYIGLDHTQLNLDDAFDADPTNDVSVPTMLPVLTTIEQVTLHADDRAAVSSLYPGPRRALLGTIRGRVLMLGGQAGALGVNVIARRVDAPKEVAFSTVTGYRYATDATELPGFFELVALPPGRYTVEVERIHPVFRSGSNVGPFSPPLVLLGPPEFFSGSEESDHDDPASKVELTVVSGAVIEGVNIILNSVATPAGNDSCSQAREVRESEFTDVVSVASATPSPDDPPNSCFLGRGQNVWYRFDAPLNGTVTVDTYGSTYDTVIGVYQGSCGRMIEISCNDNASLTSLGWFTESQLSFNVRSGQTYYIEVARSATDSRESLLRFHLRFHPAVNGPDLALDDLRLPSTSVRRGSEALLGFTIINQGDRPASGAVHEVRLANRNYRLSVSPPLASVVTRELRPGETVFFQVPVVIPGDLPPGTYFLGIVLDTTGGAAESLEGNNIIAIPLEVISG